MNRPTKIGLILACIIIVVIVINRFTGDVAVAPVREIIYAQQADEDYVSNRFNVLINESYKVDKSFVFHCTINDEGHDCYIVLDYPSQNFYSYDESEGYTREEAQEIVVAQGYEVSGQPAELLLFNFETKVEDLRWLVHLTGEDDFVYVGFVDGIIYGRDGLEIENQ